MRIQKKKNSPNFHAVNNKKMMESRWTMFITQFILTNSNNKRVCMVIGNHVLDQGNTGHLIAWVTYSLADPLAVVFISWQSS